MSSAALEAYLARLYTDAAAREAFLADPEAAARSAGMTGTDALALCSMDKVGLRMAAESYAHKREQHRQPKKGLQHYLQNIFGKL